MQFEDPTSAIPCMSARQTKHAHPSTHVSACITATLICIDQSVACRAILAHTHVGRQLSVVTRIIIQSESSPKPQTQPSRAGGRADNAHNRQASPHPPPPCDDETRAAAPSAGLNLSLISTNPCWRPPMVIRGTCRSSLPVMRALQKCTGR